MAEGKRPGGLTALAIFNFVFGGLGCLLSAILAVPIFIFLRYQAPGAEPPPELQEVIDTVAEAGLIPYASVVVMSLLSSVLEILAGIGYLLQKKFLGRMIGNAYAVTSLAYIALGTAFLPGEDGGGGDIGTILGLIYPMLTLILINTTFKEDFVN